MESVERDRNVILPEGYAYHPEGYLWHILPEVKFADLPGSVDVEGQMLNKKSEFHVTVANARNIARTIAGEDPQKMAELEIELQQLLSAYIGNTPISFDHFIDDLRLAISHERQSIAARCVVNNLEGYFDLVGSRYGHEFPHQPAHVSIYTKTGAAVGIDSREQMESYTKIDLPEVQSVLDTIHTAV